MKKRPWYISPECWKAKQKAARLEARLDREAERSVLTPKRKPPVPTISSDPLTFRPPILTRAEIAAILAQQKKKEESAKQRAEQKAEAVRQRTELTLYRSRKTGLFWRKIAEVEGRMDQMERVSTSEVSVQENGTALWNGKTVQIVNI